MAGEVIEELWAIASGAGPVDVRVFVLLGEPMRYSISNNEPKLLVTKVPLFAITVQNLGTIAIELGGSRKLMYGQGVRVPPNSQWTPGGVAPIGASSTDTALIRPHYYDRNPLNLNAGFIGLLAPAGATIRASYTVPTSKKGFLQRALALNARATAAAPADRVQTYINFIPSGGVAQTICLAVILTNGVGDRGQDGMAGVGLMSAGDQVTLNTFDASIGGTVWHWLGLWHVEFDA